MVKRPRLCERHTCHLPGCDTECPPAHLYCRAHWAMVPDDLQAQVYSTVRRRGRYVDASWAPWWRAQAEAEAAVLRRLHPDREEAIAHRLGKANKFADQLEGRG